MANSIIGNLYRHKTDGIHFAVIGESVRNGEECYVVLCPEWQNETHIKKEAFETKSLERLILEGRYND